MTFTDQKSHSNKEGTNGNLSSIATFVAKIYNLLRDPQNASVICWDEQGKSFTIKNQTLFTSKILPIYFKHNNYQSFIRQLNMYNFTKLKDSLAHRFQNPYFIRGGEELLQNIKRKPQRKKKKQSKDYIINQKENQAKLQMFSQKYIINQSKGEIEDIKPQFCNLSQGFQDKLQNKAGFLSVIEVNNGCSSEDHMSTIIEPTIKWINNKQEQNWISINSFKSNEPSVKLIQQDENKQSLTQQINLRQIQKQTPIILLFHPNITQKTIKQL